LWRTSVTSLFGDSMLFSEISTYSGSMRNGRLYQRAPWVHHTHDAGCSSWPTPREAMSRIKCHMTPSRLANSRIGKGNLEEAVAVVEGDRDGYLNPRWVEWLMGFPGGWCVPPSGGSATQPSRKSRSGSDAS
jgi:hypothetical protein